MKTKITAAAILIAASLTFLYSFKAQQGNEEKADFAIMRIAEPYGGPAASGIVLSYSNGKSEPVKELENLKIKNAASNLAIINSYLVRLKKEGYKLKAVTGGEYMSTYIFEKE